MHFQEWWVRLRAEVPASRFVVAGLDRAAAAPGVLDALRDADVIVLPPSNPVVSIGIILGVPGVRDALRGSTAPVVGVSPLISGRPVRGHADACLSAIGVESTSAAVAGLYADFLDGWLVDPADASVSGARGRDRRPRRAAPHDRRRRGHRGHRREPPRARRARPHGELVTRPLTIVPVLGVPEVREGDDVAGAAARRPSATGGLAPGDVVVVSSKVVSKALGLRATGADKSELVLRESRARRRRARRRVTGSPGSSRRSAGPVMAAAGIDASNTGPSGELLLLPHDPDACARDRALGAAVPRAGMPSSAPLAVVLSDTAGRPWRAGLTDFALGSAGLQRAARPPRRGGRRRAGDVGDRAGRGRRDRLLPPTSSRARPTASRRPWSAGCPSRGSSAARSGAVGDGR